jgi:membrane protein YdbS with pleckstrin-like domain
MYSSIELQPHESVLQEVRRARMTLTPGVTFGAFVVLANFFLLAWWFQHDPWGPLAFAAVLGLGAFIILRAVVLWRKNILVITNQRVIYFQQRGLFDQIAIEVGYEKIQDIRYSIQGIVQTMYKIGTITLQTAGSTNVLSADFLPQPMRIQRIIADQQRKATGHGLPLQPRRSVLDLHAS